MADNDKETEVSVAQFKRTMNHLLITEEGGPELTIGDRTIKFKKKAPVAALQSLLGEENNVAGMIGYIKNCLAKDQEGAIEFLVNDIDLEGLSEVLNWLNEAYTSFPEKS